MPVPAPGPVPQSETEKMPRHVLNAIAPPPRGITLLEVLIACGVLVTGLASVAALLPAAGSRLGQASVEDRAGVLAANARADITSRGLLAADLFSDPAKAVAFGKVVDGVPALSAATPYMAVAVAAVLQQRLDARSCTLEDELVYAPPTTAETPLNSFADGRRECKEGLCWGATLTVSKPQTIPAAAGGPAVLSIAVFRKEGQAKEIPLVSAGGGLYRMDPSNESDLKTYLKGCSYVMAMPTAADKAPRWVRITASWKPPIDPDTGTRIDENCYVAFADPDFETFAGGSPRVIGFESLLRVDQHVVTLE